MHRPCRRVRPLAAPFFMVDDERVLLVKPAVRLGLEFQTESAVDSLPGIDGTLVSGLPGDDASVRVLAGDDASPFPSFPVSIGHRSFCLSLFPENH